MWYSLATSLVELRSWIFVPREYEHHTARKINFFFEITCNPLFMNFQEIYFSWVSSLLTLEIGLTVSLLVTCFSSGQLLRKKQSETTSMKCHFVCSWLLPFDNVQPLFSTTVNILNLLCVFFFFILNDFSDCFKLKKFLLYAKKDKKSLKVQTNSNCE